MCKKIIKINALVVLSIIVGLFSIYNKLSIALIIALIASIIFINYRKPELIIIFIIIINENLLRLSSINITSLVAILSIIIFIVKFKSIVKKRYIFKNYIITLMVICGISQIGAYFAFGQNLKYGILGMHHIFIYLFYFYFVDFFNKERKRDLRNNVKNIIIYMGTTLSILYLIQAIIYPKVVIFNMSYAFRGGSVRFFTGYVFIMFSIVIIYSKLLTKFERKYFLHILIQIVSLVVVSQTRNFILGVLIVIVYGLFMSKKINKVWLVYTLITAIFIYMLMFSNESNFLNEVINSVLIEIKTKTGNIGVRYLELEYYMNLLKDNLISGIGLLDTRYYLTPIITGYDPYLYFVGDLGLIGVVIQTGVLGGIWMLAFFNKMYIVSKKNLSNDTENSYLLRLTLILIVGVFASGLIFDKNSILYICMILGIVEPYYCKNED
ncbi:hypothetical protein CHL78_009515 [Romboutsia weinsteinii]|uniref:O-antigen ligase domain-containing protein n=1 Tax=Romboutsia weinsteinii TaxID=2020949 RepID=A0A371J3U0_9FIRM|nr:hypothetical protein [Romboutsia weinsteinii]RDY27442.1 hypothetical protein CHL78_009515 [Romboutsia weinsteinii]